ncbi:hypothetical protein T484DRAFT_1760595, partial [Baffinella frigidus]
MADFNNDGSFMANFIREQAEAAARQVRERQAGGAGGAATSETPAGRSGEEVQEPVQRRRRRFTDEPDAEVGSSSAAPPPQRRKFTEGAADESGEARRDLGLLSADDLVQLTAHVEDKQEEETQTNYVPRSSHVANLLPAEDMAKYTTLLPGAKKAKDEKEKEEDKVTIDSSNIGHKMLSKMGWKGKGLGAEGQMLSKMGWKGKGLCAEGQGKVAPVAEQKGVTDRSGVLAGDMHGLGADHTWDLNGEEDMFEQYRKRMMLG